MREIRSPGGNATKPILIAIRPSSQQSQRYPKSVSVTARIGPPKVKLAMGAKSFAQTARCDLKE